MTGLLPATTYLIRMQAINEIERSEFTDPIILKTQETAPTEAPSNVQVESGGDGELVVTWQVCGFSAYYILYEYITNVKVTRERY